MLYGRRMLDFGSVTDRSHVMSLPHVYVGTDGHRMGPFFIFFFDDVDASVYGKYLQYLQVSLIIG